MRKTKTWENNKKIENVMMQLLKNYTKQNSKPH